MLRSRRTWQRVLSERLEASAAMGNGLSKLVRRAIKHALGLGI